MTQLDPDRGDWKDLASSEQAPRYVAIERMLRSYRAQRSVLDVGCGEAILRHYLPRECAYRGVDASPLAVGSAWRRFGHAAHVVCCPAEHFEPVDGERYSAVVFNEMLYYVGDPARLVRKYAAMLDDGGIVVVSIYRKPERPLVALRRVVAQAVGTRRPVSNLHCSNIVDACMHEAGWSRLARCRVKVPHSALHWEISAVRPR